jgi:hypothetical protein
MHSKHGTVATQKNIEQLTRSLERLSLYDGKGNKKNLQISPKQNFEKILGGLTLEDIDHKM